MTRYFSLLLLVLGGCTEVDDRLGASLLPDNQRMGTEVITVANGVETFLYRADSLPSSRMGYAYFGRMTDEGGVFGSRTNSALLQFVPITIPYSEVDGYGLRPIVDSIDILFEVETVRGDDAVEQTFDVYDVSDAAALSRDSVYHANFPIDDFRGEKLFEFTHTGRGDIEARLFPTAAGREYLNRLVTMNERDEWDDYTDDSAFVRHFPGLYITPSEDSPRAAVLRTPLNSAGLRLHVRNHDTLDVNAIYDTITTLFSFSDNDEYDSSTGRTTTWNNVSIGMADFDYTGSRLGELETQTDGFTDTLTTSTPLSTVYLQSMGGVGTFLRFTDGFIEQVKNLSAGDRNVAINQAVMRLRLTDGSTTAMDASMARVGSYTDYRHLTTIPDYLYSLESSDYELAYNGHLNRSNGYYELDITAYIQSLAAGELRPTVYLGPEAYNLFGFGESTLDGSGSSHAPTIRITYTTIEK